MPRKKIPTKAELIRLQKLYKTDEKIAERLGNVTPQLVAYWRRKKNIPRYSFPKFSIDEIKDLWERFGDDYRCGLELGISKAAFYNWRRKYNIRQKPAFLKLEQLELNLGEISKNSGRQSKEQQTIIQKIVAERIEAPNVEIGRQVEVEPDLAVVSDDALAIINKFQTRNLAYVWNPNRIVIALAAGYGQADNQLAEIHKLIREFVKKQNIKYFYDTNQGGCHQLVVENGRILPGHLAVSTLPDCLAYGSIGAGSLKINQDDMAELWSTRSIKFVVPQTVKINITGKLLPGVYAKDVALFIAQKVGPDDLKGKAVEFYGSAVSSMSVSERFTLTGLTAGLGTQNAVCSFDSITRRYMLRRTKMPFRPALADKGAIYEKCFELNIEQLTPLAAPLNKLDQIKSVEETSELPVDQVIIGSGTNGRFDDLRIVAEILKSGKIHTNVRLIIMPSSRNVYLEALKKGLVRAFIESGATVLNPGSISCNGFSYNSLASTERCLTTAAHFGSGEYSSEIYSVSPATAAVSALRGVLSDPMKYVKK